MTAENQSTAFAAAYLAIELDIVKIKAAAGGLTLLHEETHGDDQLGEASFFLAQCILDHANRIQEALWPEGKEAAS